MNEFTQNEWLDMFSALNSETRYNILIFLNSGGEKSRKELCEKFTIVGFWFIVHINALMDARLIDYSDRPKYDSWEITEKGKKVLEILST